MRKHEHHERPFDEATQTKLQLFRLYTKEWLPVFLTESRVRYPRIDIFDFFAGPGEDAAGEPGSPLLILKSVEEALQQPSASKSTRVHLHFFDKERSKVEALRQRLNSRDVHAQIELHVEVAPFDEALPSARHVLTDPRIPKLLFVDQFGVSAVSDGVFREIAGYPKCDWLFFVSSWTHYRFRGHPAIPDRIGELQDSQQVHQAVTAYYRGLLPIDDPYWVVPFSLKKRSNVYGVTFCTRHVLGALKFLQSAWRLAPEFGGAANFDLDGDGLVSGQLALSFLDTRPTKVRCFQDALEVLFREQEIGDERDVLELCLSHGVLPSHASDVIKKLKDEGFMECDFRVPQRGRWKTPRAVRYLAIPHSRG